MRISERRASRRIRQLEREKRELERELRRSEVDRQRDDEPSSNNLLKLVAVGAVVSFVATYFDRLQALLLNLLVVVERIIERLIVLLI